jgi:two-component system chemotaxis response regulator CheY
MSENRITAVVVEDDTVSRTLLRGVLRGLQVDVMGEAASGRRGIELIRQNTPSLVCLDIGLPDVDGGDLIAEVKSHCPAARVIMVTGTAKNDKVRAALAAGAEGYIVKPYASSTLRATLKRLFPDHAMD